MNADSQLIVVEMDDKCQNERMMLQVPMRQDDTRHTPAERQTARRATVTGGMRAGLTHLARCLSFVSSVHIGWSDTQMRVARRFPLSLFLIVFRG